MEFRKIQPDHFQEYILGVRKSLVDNHGFAPTPQMLAPLEGCHYFGLFSNHKIIGLIELFRYDEMHGGYRNNVFSNHFDLSQFCAPENMAHVRSLFINEEHRRSSMYFMFFYAKCLTYCLHALGCRYFTMTTTRDPYLLNLYNKMGFRDLCPLHDYPGQKPNHLLLLICDMVAATRSPAIVRWGYTESHFRNADA